MNADPEMKNLNQDTVYDLRQVFCFIAFSDPCLSAFIRG